ncbi:uncharacterized protein LOC131013956 [Salvia miltiorrhiza]|uniref:uncharacterized protein LOC131013956 n=1 Tax=Salvia miltiorrhiza TaxID=226208 RepID=UPI0025AD0B6E|nr:uncharacterized protein LOC131013956 [Salvia miltiorrhiza]
MKMKFVGQCSSLLILGLALYLISISCTNKRLLFPASDFFYPLLKPTQFPETPLPTNTTPTNLSHLVFGLLGSEKGWCHRRAYIESWWRPNATRGVLFLDKAPSAALLPWPGGLPPYKVSDDLTGILNKSDIRAQRMVHGIMEAVREMGDEEFRWLVMGDDDSIFYVDNIADVVATYDHSKYFYLGGQSEFIMSSYWFSFNQAFGGAGIILSAPLAKALAADMENCLKRYAFLNSADNTTKNCIADIGANLSPQMGNHQIDLRGDISGLLSSHPLSPLLSLHHLDVVDPIFPFRDRFESARHLMTAAAVEQSRMLQQIICHDKESNWSISIAWGYSAQIYETIFPRSYLQMPLETFKPWMKTSSPPPYYRFNTRPRSNDPCEAPHSFFLEVVEKAEERREIITTYARAWPRPLPPCSLTGAHSADGINMIQVYSPASKRNQMDRCECCDIIGKDNLMAEVRLRECMADEIIA